MQMAQPSDSLIFGRTDADIARARYLAPKIKLETATTAERAEWETQLKAYFNYTDANRIETWTRYVADLLTEYGYTASVTTKTTLARGDELSLADVTRMRRNIDTLQTAFYSIPDWREITYTSSLGFEQVNTLEWDLQTINRYLEATIEAMKIRQANTLFMISGGVFNA